MLGEPEDFLDHDNAADWFAFRLHGECAQFKTIGCAGEFYRFRHVFSSHGCVVSSSARKDVSAAYVRFRLATRRGCAHARRMGIVHRVAAAAAFWIASAGTAPAECIGADQLSPLAAPAIPELQQAGGEIARGRGGRMVAPMMVNGDGPFRFIVDTGANRSAVSQALAERLGLTPTGTGDVHSISGVTQAPMAQLRALRYGGLDLQPGMVPIVEGAVLGGEEGLLGVDGMQGRRLRIDFENRCIEISSAETPLRQRRGWTEIQGELRFGHLVVVRGRIRGQDVNVLIDTGSDSTLANLAFREQVRGIRVSRDRTDYARAYTAGTPIVLDSAVLIPQFSLGDVNVTGITAYVADFHIFRLWDFVDEPALLIGMDVLAQTRAIAIDYENAKVYFRLRDRVRTGSRLPAAGSNPGMIIE
jgi:predicted aspartyl protease